MKMEDHRVSAEFILEQIGQKPVTAVVLGSGLGNLAEELESACRIDYRAIPHFPVSTAPGHKGELIFGCYHGADILIFSGRFHYYEGWSVEQSAYYVRVLKMMGVRNLVLTNAAGCINEKFRPGDLMMVSDHINLTGLSPARGENREEFGPRFFDMTDAYSKVLRRAAAEYARLCGVPLREGVYAYMTGPQYETPAEIRALRVLGADAVGMSTVPEVIEAAHCGLRTLCISCLTNYAAGISGRPLSGQEVVEAASQSAGGFSRLLGSLLPAVGKIE